MTDPPPTWELTDTGYPPTPVARKDVVHALLERRLSFQAKVRSAPEWPWTHVQATPEFYPACPEVRWNLNDRNINEARGLVAVSSDPANLLATSRRIRASPQYAQLGFFAPVLTSHPGPPFTAPAALFRLWEGVFVGVVFESHALRPGMYLHGYVIAFNLSGKPQMQVLVPKGYPIPEDQRASLNLNLPAWRWSANKLFLPVTPAQGEYTLEFRSTSNVEKAGKAIAATALTLGMFTYIPGHSGFKASFRVLDARTVGALDSFEAAALKAVHQRFADAHADHAAAPGGKAIPKDEFLTRFRQYLWYNPERTIDALSDEKAAAEAYPRLYERFLLQEYGGEVVIGTPEAQTGA